MTGDTQLPDVLVQIVDAALADATRRSGSWLSCRPGCSACCHGVFSISALDANRLRQGLLELTVSDPERAQRIRDRTRESVRRLAPDFPGDLVSGHLHTSPEAELAFEEFGNDEPCPVLDPITQTCDLYSARPILCRTFGPPLQTEDGGLAVCELCFNGAPEEEIARSQIDPGILNAEATANAEHALATMDTYTTVIAFAVQEHVALPV